MEFRNISFRTLSFSGEKGGTTQDPENGEMIQGKYIFGKETSINGNDLTFSLGEDESTSPVKTTLDESLIILVIIIIGGIGAVLFFLKGYKK